MGCLPRYLAPPVGAHNAPYGATVSGMAYTPAPLPATIPAPMLAPAKFANWQQVAGAWLAEFRSAHTQDAYRRDLHGYADVLAAYGIADPLSAERHVVAFYARYLDSTGLAPASKSRKLAAISSFYRYAARAGVVPANPAEHVARWPSSSDSPRLGMSADEARRVIAAARARTATHRALLALCLCAGLRVSEALAVTPADMAEVRGHRVVRVTGKGGKVRSVPLSPLALDLLADALAGCESGSPVVRGVQGGVMDRHRALRMVERLGRDAGVADALRPHDCRHTAATLALDSGAPIHRVQDLLGHSSPTTTQRYVQHRERLDHSAAYDLGRVLAG